jgi:MoaA/NifB/PqqE/SkfB family radical SAM enzyme
MHPPTHSGTGTWRRQRGFFGELIRRNFRRGTLPYKAILVLTWSCQARCVMCDIWKRRPLDELTFDEYDTFFTRNPYFTWLTYTGGEPFLREDLVELAELAFRKCPRLYCINSPTNSLDPDGILDKVEKILQIGLPRYVLSISLDGPPDVHDRVRGLPGTFAKAMRVLTESKKLEKKFPSRFMVVLEHCLLPPAYEKFRDMVNAVRDHEPSVNASDFLVATANVSNHYYGNTAAAASIKTSVSHQQLEQALQHILAARREAANLTPEYILPQTYLDLAVPYVRSARPPMRCRATRSTLFIDPNGIVYPCNSYTRELGRLRDAEYSLEKILGRADMEQIRKDIDEFKCGGCWTPCEASQSLAETFLSPAMAWRMVRTLWPHRPVPNGRASTAPADANAPA